jgi:formylglycine-generating enzyme required for sulfatase activity
VDQATWYEATNFCRLLSVVTGRAVRLPTEAEWEYACRAGTTTEYNTGTTLSTTSTTASVRRETSAATLRTRGVCTHAWERAGMVPGLVFLGLLYSTSPSVDPSGPASGVWRVLRGGCYDWGDYDCRSACRYYVAPGRRSFGIGFRVVSPGP